MAQETAKIALEGKRPVVEGAPSNTSMENLKCGLYLVIARGAGMEAYTTENAGEEGEALLGTLADSEHYRYTFLPVLVSIPGKEGAGEALGGNTADAGPWLYQMEVLLKSSRQDRYGSLEIVKTLQSYETKEPATFVFSVEAVKDGEVVYSNVVSFTFEEAGQKEAPQ